MCDVYLSFTHRNDILNIINDLNREKHFSINISFLDLFEFDTNLGSALLDSPEQSLLEWDSAANKVQRNLIQENEDDMSKVKNNVHCRIYNLPPWPHVSRTIFPSNEDSEKYLQVTGIVIRISAPKLLEFQRDFICTKCKYPIMVAANFDKRNIIKKPKSCSNPEGCNGKNIISFGEINRDNCKDYQEIKIQEDLSKIGTGNVPNTMHVALEDDLVNVCNPGENITICGILKRTWKEFSKGQKLDVNLVLKANHVQVNSKTNLLVSPDDRILYENYWKKYYEEPLLGRTLILKSISPQIYGLHLVKLAIAVVLAGGSQNETSTSTGLDTRSEPHLLLVGDPGTGKSQLLRFASKIISRSVLTTGVGSSAAGLTVTALMEKGEWKLEAGALVMSDGGICCIDEFNSMKEHDRTTIHEAMEQQTISVAKAGIVCKLKTRCSLLAACNPKGNLDLTEPLCMNIAMASPLLSRFDLVLLIKDNISQEGDTDLTDYILNHPSAISKCTHWPLEKLQSYFIIIKTLNPKLTDDAEEILSKYYQLQRNSTGRNKSRTTVRLLESIIRLSQGHAKLMFHEDVEIMDAIFAIILADASMDYESSLLNIRVNTCNFFDDPLEFYHDALVTLLPKLGLEHILEKEMDNLKNKNIRPNLDKSVLQENNEVTCDLISVKQINNQMETENYHNNVTLLPKLGLEHILEKEIDNLKNKHIGPNLDNSALQENNKANCDLISVKHINNQIKTENYQNDVADIVTKVKIHAQNKCLNKIMISSSNIELEQKYNECGNNTADSDKAPFKNFNRQECLPKNNLIFTDSKTLHNHPALKKKFNFVNKNALKDLKSQSITCAFDNIDLDESLFNDKQNSSDFLRKMDKLQSNCVQSTEVGKPTTSKSVLNLEGQRIESTEKYHYKSYKILAETKNVPKTNIFQQFGKQITEEIKILPTAKHIKEMQTTRSEFDNIDFDESIFNDNHNSSVRNVNKLQSGFVSTQVDDEVKRKVTQNLKGQIVQNKEELYNKSYEMTVNTKTLHKTDFLHELQEENSKETKILCETKHNKENKETKKTPFENRENIHIDNLKLISREISDANTTNINIQNICFQNDNTKSILNKLDNSQSLPITKSKKKRSLLQINHNDLPENKVKKIKKNEKPNSGFNDLQLLNLLPSVNDDILNFNLDWDDYDRELSQQFTSYSQKSSGEDNLVGDKES